DPRDVVKSGQVVRVKVLEADPERKRISLTLRLDDEPAAPGGRAAPRPDRSRQAAPQTPSKQPSGKQAPERRTPARQPQKSTPAPAPANTAMAEALRRAGLGK
ncbi:S1 RNA-binding domain-containing protein, partial [uncultured Arthrobacter sp.]|uniref:S1 RNA-binding domain-containing protein n=1 Tax=uncultured Arthrobacter sp. TaxID=114050 RepID=UPI003216C9EE